MTLNDLKKYIGEDCYYAYTDMHFKLVDVRQISDGTILAYGDNGFIVNADLAVLESTKKALTEEEITDVTVKTGNESETSDNA